MFENISILDSRFELFLVISEMLNLSRAADKLNVRQPWLSKVLKNLERETGQTLFIRKKTGLELTPTGKSLQQLILNARSKWSQSLKEHSLNLDLIGEIKFSAHSALAMIFFPKVLKLLESKFTKEVVRFELNRSPEALRKIINFELDFAFVANPIKYKDLVVIPLLNEPVCFYAASLSVNEGSLREGNILFNPEMIFINKLLSKYKNSSLISIPNYDVIAEMASSGNSAALLPALVAKRYPRLKRISKELMMAEICLIYRKEKQWTPARIELSQWLIKNLKKEFKS